MPELNVVAEEFLIECGIFTRRTQQRRRVLTSIACKWGRCAQAGTPPMVYGYEISKCMGIVGPLAHYILERLEEGGIIVSHLETNEHPGRPPVRYYQPIANNLGSIFIDLLEVPDQCPLLQLQ